MTSSQTNSKNSNFSFRRESGDGSTVFELNVNEYDFDDCVAQFEIVQTGVPAEIKNPCPSAVSFVTFRSDMKMLNSEVYKKIIKSGVGEEFDLERSTVTYDYAMFLESSADPFDSSILNKSPGVVCVKKGIEPLPGCFLAVESMKDKEEAIFWISHKLMFGKLGCPPRVPAQADILFHVKVIKVDDEKGDATDDEKAFGIKLKEAMKQHGAAREEFQLGNYQKATTIYRKWINIVEEAHLATVEEEEKVKEVLVKMYLNVTICYNKMNKPAKACLMIRQLEKLTSIEQNPKALYAMGKAKLMLNDYKYARKYLQMAHNLVPNDKAIISTLSLLENQEQEQQQHDAETAKLVHKYQSEATAIEEKKCAQAGQQR